MSSSDGSTTLDLMSSPAFAFFSWFKSSRLHSNIHCESRAMNVAYRECDSVVQPVAKRRMKHQAKHQGGWLCYPNQQGETWHSSQHSCHDLCTWVLVSSYQWIIHGAEPTTFTCCEDADKNLAKFITYIGCPCSCSSSSTCQLSCNLENKRKENENKNKMKKCSRKGLKKYFIPS